MEPVLQSLTNMRTVAMQKKTVVLALAVAFVAALGGVVVNSHCADLLHKAMASKDADALARYEKVYKWSMVSAVLSAVIMVGALGSMVVVFRRK